MGPHDYSAKEALDLLMRKLRDRDAALADQIQAVVDVGKDVDETEPSIKAAKRNRIYRKTVPYSFDEALHVAIEALRAYFIEQALFVDSCLTEISAAALESPLNDRHSWRLYKELSTAFDSETQGKEKQTEIELKTETQILESAQETFTLHRVPPEQLEQQRKNFEHLAKLIDFRIQ